MFSLARALFSPDSAEDRSSLFVWFIDSMARSDSASWRTYCGKAALILATCAMLLELVFYYSWFQNGGSPHGLMPSAGIWRFVGPIAFWILVVSLVFTAFGKGKWRIFIPIWAVAYAIVVKIIAMFEMD